MKKTFAAFYILSCATLSAECNQPCFPPTPLTHPCQIGVEVSAEFLYWYAKQSDLEYATTVRTIDQDVPISSIRFARAKERGSDRLDTAWDPGFRVGARCTDSCGQWDLWASWTYFRNTSKSETNLSPAFRNPSSAFPKIGEEALLNPWVNPSTFFASGGTLGTTMPPLIFDQIQARSKIYLNSIELNLHYHYCISPCLELSPFVGLRGVWLRTELSTQSLLERTARNANLLDRFDNRLWGIGPGLGVDPRWYLSDSWSLFARLGAALVWGEQSSQKTEDYFVFVTANTTPAIDAKRIEQSSVYQLTPILDLAIGLRYDLCFCDGRINSYLALGWEHHMWLGANHYQQYIGNFIFDRGAPVFFSGFRRVKEIKSNLGFGGPTLRIGIGF